MCLRKCTVHTQSIVRRIYRKTVLAQDRETPSILLIISSSITLFITRGNLNAPTLALICDFLRSIIIIILYYIEISIPPMSLFMLIVFVTVSRNRGHIFCRANKDQSKTGSLITIPCFSSRILILDHVGIAPAIFAPISLFCGLPRTYSTSSTLQSSYVFSSSVSQYCSQTVFFNVCRVGTCCTRIY